MGPQTLAAAAALVLAASALLVAAQPSDLQLPDVPPLPSSFTNGVKTTINNPYGPGIYGQNVGKNSLGGIIHKYNWSVSWAIAYPDCVARRVVVVNNRYPGPTIRITENDSAQIWLYNNMPSESITMHWHGIRQLGQPWQDGAAFINQCPIQPNSYFKYEFSVPKQHGTFWYHTHLGLIKSAGALGLFIVDPLNGDPFAYDQDIPFLLSDWLHMDETFNAQYITFVANSLLLNGRGQFNCTPGKSNIDPWEDCRSPATTADCGYTTFDVQPNKKYLLRIINTGGGENILLQFQSHNLTLVLADGGYTQPISISQLWAAPGQSFGVILQTNQPLASYWIYLGTFYSALPFCPYATNTDGFIGTAECPKLIATLHYIGASSTNYSGSPPLNLATNEYYPDLNPHLAFVNSIVMRAGYEEKLPAITRTIFIDQAAGWDGYFPAFDLNRIEGVFPTTPVLHASYFKVPLNTDTTSHSTYNPIDLTQFSIVGKNGTKGTPIYNITLGEGVMIVFQNSLINATNFPDPMVTSDPNYNYTGLYASVLVTSISHAWHLHGHDFWVLGTGLGVYDNKTDFGALNFKNPIKRNVTPMTPLGWTAILYYADNPGAWICHCHFDQHLAAGMFVVFLEGVGHIPAPPKNTQLCGALLPTTGGKKRRYLR